MSILLLGSTGMGKSTFGNFLLDPDDKHMFDEQTFAAATDNTPMTQEVRAVEKKVRIEGSQYETLSIIDTPGLNESAAKDLSHMIQIIDNLSKFGKFRACILVVKFNTKIDMQYKATIQYYSRLLPGLFDKNVIIVMTDFATDDRSEKIRERQRIDVAKVIENTITELCRCSNSQLSYKPQLFMIDCLPLDAAEMEISLTVRTVIIDYIFQSLIPISITDRMVAKTDYIKQKDALKIELVQGEIEGYKARLKQANQKSEEALDETQKREKEINEIQKCIEDLTRRRDDLDKKDDVVAESWSIEERWKMFRWFTREFKVESSYEMTRNIKWTNGRCKFKDITETTRSVKGKVEGKFMRGVYASVTIYTQKRQKYAREIIRLHNEISTAKKNLEAAKVKRDKFKEKHNEHIKEIKLLEDYIEKKNRETDKLSSDLMTIEEAKSRLKELGGL